MRRHVEQAPAKINLTLDILGLRPDGYHEMDMLMQSVSLSDAVTLALEKETGVRLVGDTAGLPTDRRNLAVDAAHRFLERTGREGQGLSIGIEKRIPVCAGTAGGSSDAAAVLRGLNQLLGTGLSLDALADLGAQVGSDVPYCVLGGTARARGRGEELTPLTPLPYCYILLCKPGFAVSTPELFRLWDEAPSGAKPDTEGMLRALEGQDLPAIAAGLCNVFEDVLPPRQRGVVERIRRTMLEAGALGSSMSGTGPTVFGIFSEKGPAEAGRNTLRQQYAEVFLTTPV